MRIDSEIANRHTNDYPLGTMIAEGKTKVIHAVANKPELAIIIGKNDITAGDGAKHDVIPHKGEWATETTCNVFELLKAAGLPLAFVEQDNVNSFVAPLCTMLPYEVVVRRQAHGSYLKRHIGTKKGDVFSSLLVEFYLKTKDKKWKDHDLPCDDPLMYFDDIETIGLYEPSVPETPGPFLVLHVGEVWVVPEEDQLYQQMRKIAKQAFELLESAWLSEGAALVDLKVEFGLDANGNLLLADVIDNDSWRVVRDGKYLDKQTYRDGGGLGEVAALYQEVANITARFNSST